MPKDLKIGDRVRWNSEAGLVGGVIIKKVTADTNFKGYTHHASPEAPQYLIKSRCIGSGRQAGVARPGLRQAPGPLAVW